MAEQAEPGRLCRAAIAQAERTHGTPAGLMAGIARIESGRRDPLTGNVHPWPWTINAEGRGALFDSKAEAIAAVRREQARGVRSIDVGCMQINLMYHPTAFATLEEAFDPVRNADYAARYLRTLHAQTGAWESAAGRYHSGTPELAAAYLSRLAGALAEEARRGDEPLPPGSAPAPTVAMRPTAPGAVPLAQTVGAAGIPGAAVAPTGPGRGLDAYRAAPVAITSGGRR